MPNSPNYIPASTYLNNYQISNCVGLNERRSYMTDVKTTQRVQNEEVIEMLDRTNIGSRSQPDVTWGTYNGINSKDRRRHSHFDSLSSSSSYLTPGNTQSLSLPKSNKNPMPLPRSRPVSILQIPEEEIEEFYDPVYENRSPEYASHVFVDPVYENTSYSSQQRLRVNNTGGSSINNNDIIDCNKTEANSRNVRTLNYNENSPTNISTLPNKTLQETRIINGPPNLGARSISESSVLHRNNWSNNRQINYGRRHSMADHHHHRNYYNEKIRQNAYVPERQEERNLGQSRFYFDLSENLSETPISDKSYKTSKSKSKSTGELNTKTTVKSDALKDYLPSVPSNVDLVSYTNQILEENSLIHYETVNKKQTKSINMAAPEVCLPPELPLRNSIIKEQNLHVEMLVKNERSYIDSLLYIQNYKDNCSDFHISELLKNIDYMLKLHNTLYESLKKNNSVGNVAKSFLLLASDFDVYIYHVMNEPNIAKCLEKIKSKDPQIQECLRKTYLRPSYYFQTLEIISKKETVSTKQSMKDAVAMLQEVYKRADSVLLLDSIKKCSFDLKSHLPLLLHATLHVYTSYWKKAVECFVVLLNDILVISKKKEKMYILVESIPMDKCQVDLGVEECLFTIERKTRSKSGHSNYIFYCKSETMRNQWYDKIHNVINRSTLRKRRHIAVAVKN